MNVIICGVDGSFKSTVASKLSKRFDVPVVRGSSFEMSQCNNQELFEKFLEIANLDNKIIDRHIYSNLTYAPLYEGYAMINPKQRSIIENKIKSNSIVIYLTASVDVIADRLNVRGDEYIENDRIGDIIRKYNTVMSSAVKNGVRVHTFDTGILSSDEVVKQVSHLLFTSSQTLDVTCKPCKKEIGRNNSFFNGTHCFSCYLEVMYDIFRKRNKDEQ